MNVLEKHKISPEQLGLLQFIAINGKNSEYVRAYIKELLISNETLVKTWEEQKWITYIKQTKKSDGPHDLVRLGEQGAIIVKTYGDVGEHPLTKDTFDIIKELYKKNKFDPSKIKGGKDVYHSISEFLHYKSHYTDKMIKAVLRAYVESFEMGKEIYALRTDTLFWRKPNAYTKKWDPSNCPLVDWIDVNGDLILRIYKNIK